MNDSLITRLVELADQWDVSAERPQCTDRMKKRTLRACRDELITVLAHAHVGIHVNYACERCGKDIHHAVHNTILAEKS